MARRNVQRGYRVLPVSYRWHLRAAARRARGRRPENGALRPRMLEAGDRAAVARAARSRDFHVRVRNRALKLTLHWSSMAP